MLTRTIRTNFWEDEKVEPLSKDATLLFAYCITNHKIGHTGIYAISDFTIKVRTKLTTEELEKAKGELAGIKRVFFYSGWVFVVNAQKFKMYTGAKNEIASNKELEAVPEDIKIYFHSLSTSYPQVYTQGVKQQNEVPKQ